MLARLACLGLVMLACALPAHAAGPGFVPGPEKPVGDGPAIQVPGG